MPIFANTIDNNEILAKRSQCDYAGNDIQTTYATKSEVTTGLSGKQDTISDLSDIRAGAADGATAVQPGDLATVATTGAYSDLSGTPTIPPALSAGNGIDITNNVVSADIDGTSLTNGANGLSVTLPVPDTTGASQGDVLSVGQSGIEWVAPSSGSSDLFYATFQSTTFNEIQNAVNDGKYVVLSRQGALFPLAAISGASHFAKAYFQSIANPYNNGSHNSIRLTTYICSYNNQWSFFYTFVPPDSSASDAGKVLTVNSSGNAEWATPSGGGSVTDVEVNGTSVVNASGVAEVTVPSGAQLVPAATSADADKVLTVDSQGTPAWSTPAAGGVTDVEVDGTSVVSGGVASITMPTELVPAVTSSDDAKVLTATYSGGGGGSYSWVTPAGLFIAQYGVSTFAEVKAAVDANKNVYCDINPNSSNKRMAFLAYVSGNTNYEFQYYRSNSSANGTDSIFVYKVDSRNTWTTTERTVKAGNINYPVTDVRVGGTSVVRGGVALIKIPTVDQTYDGTSMNAQSGTAVAGAIATKEDAFDVGTGLEMDTSGSTPTLQVEAPVDIVAGTGIAIDNPDGNTMRITNTGFPISATDAVLCGTFRGDPMYTKTYTFTGTVGTSETTISMAIDEKKGTNNVNRIWIDPSTSFILYGSAGNNVLPLSWRLGASRQGSVAVLGASTGSLSCRCVDTSSTPITLNITIRYTVSNS